MMKIQLRENLRYFEHDDTDFTIQGKQIKELPEKHLRSYSIKHYLFSGKFKVLEGDVLFNMKSALVYICPEGLYAKEYGKYFIKDLEFDTITWVAEDTLPSKILIKLNPNTSVEPVAPKPDEEEAKPDEEDVSAVGPAEEVKEESTEEVEDEMSSVNLDEMTKDELNDYAAEMGFGDEINHRMRIAEMRDKLKELLK